MLKKTVAVAKRIRPESEQDEIAGYQRKLGQAEQRYRVTVAAIVGSLGAGSGETQSYFLLHYDRPAGALLSVKECTDDDRAQAYADVNAQEAAKPAHNEVVMLLADSIETLKRTHGRYFKTAREIAQID